MSSLWGLPGPHRFVRSVADTLQDGSSVVLRFGSAPPDGFEEHVERHSRWGLKWTVLEAETGARPLSFLRRAVVPEAAASDIGNSADLARDEQFQGRLIWVNGVSPAEWPEWRSFLESYAHASRNQVPTQHRTALVLPLCGPGFDGSELSEAAVTYREFRDVVHRDDLYVLALQYEGERVRSRVVRSLLATSVAHVAHWDHALAERLLEGGLQSALEPRPVLHNYAQERGWSAETPTNWEHGTVDGPRERQVVHSALLVVQGCERDLDRRLWAAQASVLMPLLEERRIDLIERHRSYFELPFETDLGTYETPEDLELGALVLYFHLRGSPSRKATRAAQRLRDFRNKLAHLVPLEPNEAMHPVLLG